MCTASEGENSTRKILELNILNRHICHRKKIKMHLTLCKWESFVLNCKLIEFHFNLIVRPYQKCLLKFEYVGESMTKKEILLKTIN